MLGIPALSSAREENADAARRTHVNSMVNDKSIT
jgi:hypothetical protein